ncbi:MAG: ATP-dependent Clp protease proteolytic subunit [Patescibacteria group bacterium]|jgi:ATP-dependent Clp protease protease subunit
MIGFSLPSPVLERLFERRILEISGGVDAEMGDYIRTAFSRLIAEGAPDIVILFTSTGGSAERGLEIYDILKSYPGKKTGVVIAFAQSMAAIILQACDRRLILPHATILVHNPNPADSGKRIKFHMFRDGTLMDEVYSHLEKTRQKFIDIIASRATKKTAEEIADLLDADRDLSADEAIAFGLADGLIENLSDLSGNGRPD